MLVLVLAADMLQFLLPVMLAQRAAQCLQISSEYAIFGAWIFLKITWITRNSCYLQCFVCLMLLPCGCLENPFQSDTDAHRLCLNVSGPCVLDVKGKQSFD